MAVHYTIDSAQRTISITGSHDLNRTMLLDAFRQILVDPAFDPAFDTVADFSNVTYVNLDVVDLQMLVETLSAEDTRTGRFAIITGEDQGRYSLGVYFKALSESVSETRQRIFRTAAEAQNWLTNIAAAS